MVFLYGNSSLPCPACTYARLLACSLACLFALLNCSLNILHKQPQMQMMNDSTVLLSLFYSKLPASYSPLALPNPAPLSVFLVDLGLSSLSLSFFPLSAVPRVAFLPFYPFPWTFPLLCTLTGPRTYLLAHPFYQILILLFLL